MRLSGVIRGRKTPYVRLSKADQALVSRNYLLGPAVQGFIESAGFKHGDQVVVEAEWRGSVLRVLSVTHINDATPAIRDDFEQMLAKLVVAASDKAKLTRTPLLLTPPADLFPCVPEADKDYLLTEDVAETLDAIKLLALTDTRVNVRFTGPQGTGKTSLARAVAASLGFNFVKIDTATVTEAEGWWSSVQVTEQNGASVTKALPALFLYGMTTPNTVVLLDEFNRVPTHIHGAIYGLLDESGFGWSHDLQVKIERADNVLVIATLNEEDSNVGTFEMDSAIRDRFPIEVRLELLPQPELATMIRLRSRCTKGVAEQLAALAYEVEAKVGTILLHGTGTRSLIAAGKLINKGIGWNAACKATVVAAFDHRGGAGSERASVANLAAGLEIV